MPPRQLKVWLLLLLMLSHAVASCDSLVLHTPTTPHSMSFAVHHCNDRPAAETHHIESEQSHQDGSEQPSHSVHAHVSCFVSYPTTVSPTVLVHEAIQLAPVLHESLIAAPPVPPPTALLSLS